MKLNFINVRRAYFHAKARREVYVALPEEDYEEGKCGRLLKAMYGTRDAAQNWEYAYVEALEAMGFKRGKATPCAFYMEVRNLRLVVHGDDFTVLGMEVDLDWFRRKISEVFEVKFRGRIGPDVHDDKHIRILNRVVQWTEGGIEYEADQRHAEIIVNKLGLDVNSKGVSTPGCKREWDPAEENELDPKDATMYRALVARANYLAQDRSDVSFAVKELCRSMSSPTEGDWAALKRLGRYLVDKTRLKVSFPYQDVVRKLAVWVDTDYAGCRKTRKSTSGGIVMLGTHAIKAWSITQAVIALSSGEAEYYGIVKGSSVGLGIRSVLADLGCKVRLVVCTDSSAAKGMASRKGLGKVRHVEVNQLWVQDKVGSGEVELRKVDGCNNIADALTKFVDGAGISAHLGSTGQSVAYGRHTIMPEVAAGTYCVLQEGVSVQPAQMYAAQGCTATRVPISSGPEVEVSGRTRGALRPRGGVRMCTPP